MSILANLAHLCCQKMLPPKNPFSTNLAKMIYEMAHPKLIVICTILLVMLVPLFLLFDDILFKNPLHFVLIIYLPAFNVTGYCIAMSYFVEPIIDNSFQVKLS